MLDIARRNSREAEILEVVFSNGWDFMRRLLSGDKTDEPELPPPAVLRNILTDLGPVYIKLGQLMSTRPDLLPPSYLEALETLQSNVPPVPWSEIERVIQASLPQPIEQVFASIDHQPVAAGSIAQVHRVIRHDGKIMALKVQRPGIDTLIARDVALIQNIAKLVAATEFGKEYDTIGLAEEFTQALYAELDFTLEAEHTNKLRNNLAHSDWFDPSLIKIPEVDLSLTRPKVLVMEWLDGKPLLEAKLDGRRHKGDVSAERREITRTIFRVFFQQFLTDGFFHADPHPGNIFYLNDGRIALLDCGMVGSIDRKTRSSLTEMLLAIVDADASRCTQLSLRLAEPTQTLDLARIERDYDRLLRRYYNLSLDDLNTSEAFYEILQAARQNHLRWPGNIGLFAKALGNLEGVARQFDPSVNVIDELTPLMSDLFRRELIGNNLTQALFRTALEFKQLSLESPRQIGFLLERLSQETLQFNLKIQGLDKIQRTLDAAANRRTFGTVLSALILGAAIVSTSSQTTPQLNLITDILFTAASLIGLVLLVTIVRSGQLR
jgi:ubiquinone biosynthesis protein